MWWTAAPPSGELLLLQRAHHEPRDRNVQIKNEPVKWKDGDDDKQLNQWGND